MNEKAPFGFNINPTPEDVFNDDYWSRVDARAERERRENFMPDFGPTYQGHNDGGGFPPAEYEQIAPPLSAEDIPRSSID